jgi:hypothetical protein
MVGSTEEDTFTEEQLAEGGHVLADLEGQEAEGQRF